MARAPISAFALALALSACTSVASTDLKTAGMSAHMTATADGSGTTRVEVWLNVDTSPVDFVELRGGDVLRAAAGGQSLRLSEQSALGTVSYRADFQGGDAGGTVYVVSLDRSADASAPHSAAAMPAPFTIQSPAQGASFSRANDDVAVAWSNSSSDRFWYEVSGPCVSGTGEVVADSGRLVIPRGALSPQAQAGGPNCQATLTLTRERAGTIDPAFGYGGDFSARQTRVASFLSRP